MSIWALLLLVGLAYLILALLWVGAYGVVWGAYAYCQLRFGWFGGPAAFEVAKRALDERRAMR